MIGVGAISYLSLPTIVGAGAFSIGLLTILQLRLSLYTGVVPYMGNFKNDAIELIIILIGNLIGCCIMFAYPTEEAKILVAQKLSEPLWQSFVDACLCGIMIYVAVEAFKKNNISIVMLSVFGFIVCGFEHSIANACYIISAGVFDKKTVYYFLHIVIGNAIGSILFRKVAEMTYENSKDRKRLLE